MEVSHWILYGTVLLVHGDYSSVDFNSLQLDNEVIIVLHTHTHTHV